MKGKISRMDHSGAEVLKNAEPARTTEINVGPRLRLLRQERGFSIRSLAKKSGLSVNTLSLIENCKTSPSVSTLQQLANTLGIAVTAFFETGRPQNSVVYASSGHRPRVSFAHGTLDDLGAGFITSAVEPFIVRLVPSGGSGSQPIVHTGYEFVYCLKGRMVYRVDNRTYLLEPGDSLLFESHLTHQWQNVQAEPSEFLLLLCPADSHDRPMERHFSQAL